MVKQLRISLRIVLLLATLAHEVSGFDKSPVILSDEVLRTDLSFVIDGLEDTKGISPDSAAALYNKGLFTPIFGQPDFNQTFNTSATYWMAVPLKNQSDIYDWYLELHDPHLGMAAVFELVKGKTRAIGKSGYYLPFMERTMQHKNHFFLFSIQPDSNKILLVRIHEPTFSKFYISIVRSNLMIDYALKEYWLLGLYYGGLIILLLYNAVLFVQTKQQSFIWYSLFVSACILSGLREDGLGFQFIWPYFPKLNYHLFDISTIFTLFTFSAFSSSFLDFRKKNPLTFKLIWGLVILYSLIHLTESYLTNAWFISSYLYPLPYIIIYLVAIKFVLINDKPALYYVAGFTTFILGVLCFFLRNQGVIPNNVFTIYAFNFSVLSEVVIMSYALGSKHNQQQELLRAAQDQELILLKEKAELDQRFIVQLAEQDRLKKTINQELEKKVEERTAELHSRNDELTEAYKQLSFYKEKLETDWSRLDQEKWHLSRQIDEQIFNKIKGKEVDFEAFTRVFPTNEACMQYLSDLKWAKGFICKQCGNQKYAKGDLPYSRKCTRCTHRETVTSGTLFHGVKFELLKAFYITHISLFGNGNKTFKELADQLNMRQATCFNFRKKVENVLQDKSSGNSWEEVILQN